MANHEQSSNSQHEALRVGLQELVANVSAQLEAGQPGATQAHLKELLAGTTEEGAEVSPNERLAAFELLSAEQKSKLNRDLLGLGNETLDRVGRANNDAESGLSQLNGSLEHGAAVLVESHSSGMRAVLRPDVYSSGLAEQTTEGVSHEGIRLSGKLQERADVVVTWANSFGLEQEAFGGAVAQNKAHKRALGEASETLSSDYEGEQKDLTLLIDEDVSQAFADKLEQVLSGDTDSTDLEQELVEVVIGQKDSELETRTKEITGLITHFLDAVSLDTASLRQRAKNSVEDVQLELSKFRNRGQNEYHYAKRAEDAQQVFRDQNNVLMRVKSETMFTVNSERGVLSAANKAVPTIKRQIAKALTEA